MVLEAKPHTPPCEQARAKQPYSIWCKLEGIAAEARANGASGAEEVASMDSILDHLAMRVVFELDPKCVPEAAAADAAALRRLSETMCYHVMSLVHKEWRPLNYIRFKDYLAHPKANGYQSLHTTATVRHDRRTWPFEVQVRDTEMHRTAEWGKASHAAYKRSESLAYLTPGPRTPWGASRGLTARADGPYLSPYSRPAGPVGPIPAPVAPLPILSRRVPPVPLEAPLSVGDDKAYTAWLHDQLVSSHVFVFMQSSGGDPAAVWDLEAGASIKDAIWRHPGCRGSVGQAVAELRVNGDRVSADYKLRNGDAVLLSCA